MNLMQMLNATVTPLSEYQPSCRPKKPRSGNPKPQHNKANVARTDKAVKRYKEAIGPEWISTETVARRLDTTPSCVQKTLAKYHAKGILERRNADGADYYTRFKGYEWRVKP